MKLQKTLFDRIRNRLTTDRAPIVIAILQKATAREEISNRCVDEADRLLQRYRLEARCAIREYRQWQADRAVSEALQTLRMKEGEILREQAHAKAALYLNAKRDHRDLIELSICKYCDED